MSEHTGIEWTDSTWNPVRGCVKVSPGCKHCYAETFAERFRGVKGHPYEQGFDLRLVPEKLAEPVHRKKPTTYFVNSMSDLFQDRIPEQYLHDVYYVMEQRAFWHRYQVLTKRAERMRAYLSWRYGEGRIPARHIWHGVSVENRHFKSRIDELRETPSRVRFLSIEPLLEDIGVLDLRGIHWVIVGGESGASARRFQVDWARSIVAQCRDAKVAVFVKQLGSNASSEAQTVWPDGRITPYPFIRMPLLKKGGFMSEWPEDLRVREFPPMPAPEPRG